MSQTLELAQLLDDKIQRTNEAHIDGAGLRRLAEMVQGIVAARGEYASTEGFCISLELSSRLTQAADLIREAEHDGEDRRTPIEQAKEQLIWAVRCLRNP